VIRRALRSTLAIVVAVAAASCSSSPSVPAPLGPAGAAVDVLSYLIGDIGTWPRIGSHSQDQIVDRDRREVCWIKYANAKRFECWRWDDQYVYHAVDHGLDGNSDESYMFTDGRWLARYIPAGATGALPWSVDVTQNRMIWFDASCGVVAAKSYAFPYRQRAWFEPNRDAGPLGARDTLVIEYQPYDTGSTGAAEHFYFGMGVGWYEWERSGFHDYFNRHGGPFVTMNRSVWCQGP
jgi:hypothetical protein